MVLKLLSSSSSKNNIIISNPTNFRKKTFKESINIKEYINKEWFKLFKECGIKKSQLSDPIELNFVITIIYDYMGINNNNIGDITIFKNKPPSLDDAETCTICLDDIKVKDSVWCCNNCLNYLHTLCVDSWAKLTPSVYCWSCPNCRHPHDKLPNDTCQIYNSQN